MAIKQRSDNPDQRPIQRSYRLTEKGFRKACGSLLARSAHRLPLSAGDDPPMRVVRSHAWAMISHRSGTRPRYDGQEHFDGSETFRSGLGVALQTAFMFSRAGAEFLVG